MTNHFFYRSNKSGIDVKYSKTLVLQISGCDKHRVTVMLSISQWEEVGTLCYSERENYPLASYCIQVQ
jgi:hypothetical protein